MSKKDVMAVLNMNYTTKIMLPIEEAHKVQAILARHAVKYNSLWRNPRSIHYLTDYEVPEVSVLSRPADFDAQGLDSSVIREWESAINSAEDGAEITVIDPQVFAQLKGE